MAGFPRTRASAVSSAASWPDSMAHEMPSPLNGLIVPAASPTSSIPGTADGRRFSPVGSGPDRTGPSAFSSVSSHSGGSASTNVSKTLLRRDALELLERAHQAGADVQDAVGKEEDPAVARHEAAAAREGQERLEHGLERARAPVVAARGDAEGPRRVARSRRPARRAGDEAPSDAMTYRARTSRSLPSASRSSAPVTQPPSWRGSVASTPCSKRAPALTARWASMWSKSNRDIDEPEVRERLERRPREIDREAVRPVRAQVAVAGERRIVRLDPHLPHRLDGAGRQAVAADLLARERRLVHHEDVDAAPGQVVRGRGAARAALPRRGHPLRGSWPFVLLVSPVRTDFVKAFTKSTRDPWAGQTGRGVGRTRPSRARAGAPVAPGGDPVGAEPEHGGLDHLGRVQLEAGAAQVGAVLLEPGGDGLLHGGVVGAEQLRPAPQHEPLVLGPGPAAVELEGARGCPGPGSPTRGWCAGT